MHSKSLLLSAFAALLAGCGGGGSHKGSNGDSGSGLGLAGSFTITATDDYTSAGIDPDGHLVALVAQTGNGGVVSSLGYFPASAGKTPAFPAGYTLNFVEAVSDHFAIFDANDASGTEGVLILNVDTNGSAFETGREFEAADGDRIMTAADGDDGTTDFRIETFGSGSVSVSDTKSVTLPTGIDVAELSGDYLLVDNVQARAHGRAAPSARLKARANADYSLYTTSGTKLVDYAGPTGTTLGIVDGLNAKGQAIGTVTGTLSGTTGTFGVQWDKSGNATVLPGGGLNVVPGGITDSGAIVGRYAPSTTDPSQNVAVYYSGGKQTTLSAIPAGVGLVAITRNGKGIGTFTESEAADGNSENSTITAYVVK